MRRAAVACLLVMGLTLGVSALRATPIAVYNTGVDGSGALLPDGAVDPHYQLISSADPAFPGPNAVVVQSQAWPIPPWVANGPNSNWIGPRTDAGVGNLPCDKEICDISGNGQINSTDALRALMWAVVLAGLAGPVRSADIPMEQRRSGYADLGRRAPAL